MEKLDKSEGQSMDIVADNIAKLKELFPEILTENKIDFKVLQALLGEEIEVEDERYSFNWHGKSEARRLAQLPSTGTLRPCSEESVDWDNTQNLFIEGDNLEVLKLLQKSYHKQVKMIYIDPPYNTGTDFVYPDNFQDNIKNYLELTGQIDAGRKIGTNSETSGRYHTDWLNMMYPRLKLARNLLRDDGIIFISIDDNEQANLRGICDEVFGEDNFVANFIWEKRTNRENRKVVSSRHDYVICYCKNNTPNVRPLKQLPMSEKALANYKNPDNDPRGDWKSDPATAQAGHGTKSQFYVLEAPNGKKHALESGRCWLYTKEVMQKEIEDGKIWFGKDGNGVPRVKTYLDAKERGLTPESILFAEDVDTNEIAKNLLKEQFDGVSVFDTPKPVNLIKTLIQMSCDEGVVLDFFSGSCSTAHATIELNSEDLCNRRYIMVQLPEPCSKDTEAYRNGFGTIAEIGKERIRRAIKRINDIKSEYKGDLGFKVFKLDSSNLKPWDADFDSLAQDLAEATEVVKADRKPEDVLFEILLKYGLDLTLPIDIHTIAGKTVYEVGAGALIVCLDDGVTEAVAEVIGKLKEELEPEVMRVVFKDSSFASDAAKVNAVQVLKQYGIDDVKSI